MADRVTRFDGQRRGKRKSLADLLVQAARGGGGPLEKALLAKPETIQRIRDVDLARGLGVTHISVDEADNIHQHQIDAMRYFQQSAASGQAMRVPHTTARQLTLTDFSDAELVMEMIKRGYAAMKLPKDGGPPETLR